MSHHERWDGSGYPAGLKGEEIPIAARICAVVDVYDALLAKRSYKESWTAEQALAEIQQGSGTHFDPQLVAAFHALAPRLDWALGRPDEEHHTRVPTPDAGRHRSCRAFTKPPA